MIAWDTPAGRAAVLAALREARQFVSDARDDEDPDAASGADRLLAAIDALLREEGK